MSDLIKVEVMADVEEEEELSGGYLVWANCYGCEDAFEEYDDEDERDARADQLEAQYRADKECREWEVWVANVTPGASVSEFAGEDPVLWASSQEDK